MIYFGLFLKTRHQLSCSCPLSVTSDWPYQDYLLSKTIVSTKRSYSVSISTIVQTPNQLKSAQSYIHGSLGLEVIVCLHLHFCSNPKPIEFLYKGGGMGSYFVSSSTFVKIPNIPKPTQFIRMVGCGRDHTLLPSPRFVYIPLPAGTMTNQYLSLEPYPTLSLHLCCCSNPKETQ